MSTSAALAALARADVPAALGSLLEAWRDSRDPAVADLIDKASAIVAKPDAITRGIERYRRHKWERMERRRDPCELPALLQALSWGSFLALAKWPDDPRIAAAFVERLAHWPSTDQERLVEILARLRDRRGLAALRVRSVSAPAVLAIERAPWTALDPELLAQVGDALERCRAAKLERERRVMQRTAWALADPRDLDERAVLADWLLEHGDPRGELIALQLAPPSRERTLQASALIAAHRDALLGKLRDAVSEIRFRHGFLDSCRVHANRLAGLGGASEWATVRHVTVCHNVKGDPFVHVLPRARSLYSLWGDLGMRTLRALADGARPELRRLQLVDGEDLRAIATFAGLPKLRHVAFAELEPTSPLVGGPLWRRLEVVTVVGAIYLPYWLQAFEHAGSARIRTLRICHRTDGVTRWRFRLTRPATLAIGHNWTTPLLQALRALPDRCLDHVVIRGDIDRAAIADEIARIRR